MTITREAKIYPNKKQMQMLEDLLEQSRLLYNHCLNRKITKYKENKKTLSRYDLQKEVKEYGDMPATLRQMVVYRLNNAYEGFFRRGGFPRFKKYGRYRSIPLRQYGTDYKIDEKYLNIWKKYGLQGIKMRGLQELNNPSSARIVKRASGWYVQIIDEIKELKSKKVKTAVGIDLGLKYFVVDTDSNKIETPKFFRKSEMKLSHKHRQASKKKKGSNRKKKIGHIIARMQEKISNQRKDFLHKTSRYYSNKYDLVVMENLNIKGMVRNYCLAKSINDASWGIFANMLSYKLKMLGRHLVKVAPQYTSQKCSSCGKIVKKSLSVRTHICLSCGLVLCRDENASRNILKQGLDKASGQGISIENPLTRGTLCL
ncbi:MAG: transposase [Clostridia bacterium]|nr:transposase [Clostridia bacterium]